MFLLTKRGARNRPRILDVDALSVTFDHVRAKHPKHVARYRLELFTKYCGQSLLAEHLSTSCEAYLQ